MKDRIKIKLLLPVVLSFGATYFSCQGEKETDADSAASQQAQSGTLSICTDEQKSGCAEVLASGLETTAVTLTSIEENYAPPSVSPASIAIDAPAAFRFSDSGPCAGTNSFADCQPNLIQEYIAIARRMLATAHRSLKAAKDIIKEQVKDSAGIIEFSEGAVKKLHYRIDSKEKFEVILIQTELTIYLKIDGESIHMISENLNQTFGPETAETKISFTDSFNWSIDTHITSPICDKRPMIISEVMDMVGSIWYGKAMIYSPVETVSCATSPEENAYVNYTDFIGDKMQTTASTYFVPGTFSEFAKVTDYGLDQISKNFAEAVNLPRQGLEQAKNPYCVGSDKTALFNQSCDAQTPEVKDAAYGSADKWRTPADLVARKIVLPTSL